MASSAWQETCIIYNANSAEKIWNILSYLRQAILPQSSAWKTYESSYRRETICLWCVWQTVYTERQSQSSPDYTLKWFTAIVRKMAFDGARIVAHFYKEGGIGEYIRARNLVLGRETICMWYVWQTVYTERKSQSSPDYTFKWFTATIRKSPAVVQFKATIGLPVKRHLNDVSLTDQ